MLLLLVASVARADEPARLADLRAAPLESGWEAQVRLEGAFQDEIVEKIESGLAVTFRYIFEVVRPRGLVGSTLSRRQIEVTVEHDSLTRQYRLTRTLDGESPQTTATDKEEEMRRWMTELQRVRLPALQDGTPFPAGAVLRARCRLSSGFVLVFFPYAQETPWLRVPLYPPEPSNGN